MGALEYLGRFTLTLEPPTIRRISSGFCGDAPWCNQWNPCQELVACKAEAPNLIVPCKCLWQFHQFHRDYLTIIYVSFQHKGILALPTRSNWQFDCRARWLFRRSGEASDSWGQGLRLAVGAVLVGWERLGTGWRWAVVRGKWILSTDIQHLWSLVGLRKGGGMGDCMFLNGSLHVFL